MVDFSRRGFLGATLATAVLPNEVIAKQPHPLSGLKQAIFVKRGEHAELERAANFTPDSRSYYAVLPMSAGALYASCGDALAGLEMASAKDSRVKPVVLLTGPSAQEGQPQENIDLLVNHYPDIPIITGKTEDVLNVAYGMSESLYGRPPNENEKQQERMVNGRPASNEPIAPFSTRDGQIVGHGLHAYLIDIEGQTLSALYAPNGAGLAPNIFLDAIEECKSGFLSRRAEWCMGEITPPIR